jgi:hypothetical protein
MCLPTVSNHTKKHCIAKYWNRILFSMMGLKNFPQIVLLKKQLKETKRKSLMESMLKFVLVPFFSVLERNFKINLRLSAFAQMFTCILYCPNIAKCPWLLQTKPMKISHPKLTSLEIHHVLSALYCFILQSLLI